MWIRITLWYLCLPFQRFSLEVIHKLGRANQINLEWLSIWTQAKLTKQRKWEQPRGPAWLVLSDFQTHYQFVRLVRRKSSLHSCIWRLLGSGLPPLWIKLNLYGLYNSVPEFCVRKYIKPEYMGIWSAIWTCSMPGMTGNGCCMRENCLAFPPLTEYCFLESISAVRLQEWHYLWQHLA